MTSDHKPHADVIDELSTEIARRRHGDNVTASDLAQRLSPWVAQLRAEAVAAERERAARIAETFDMGAVFPVFQAMDGQARNIAAAIREDT